MARWTFAALAVLALMWGAVIVMAHALWRRRRDRHDAAVDRVALDLARHVTGQFSERGVQTRADRVSPGVFWSAVERILDNVDRDAGPSLSAAMLDTQHVARERRALGSWRVWRRALAVRRLGMLNAPSLREPMRGALQRGPDLVLLAGVLALSRLRDAPTLQWLLDHPQRASHLGHHVLMVVLKRFGPESTRVIRRSLRLDGCSGQAIELAGIDALGMWRDQRSRLLIEGLTVHGNLEVRVAAVRALGRIASPRSVQRLLRALDDSFWQVRAQAARALGEIGAIEAVPSLMRLAEDSSWWVRRRATYALGAMGKEGTAALRRIKQGQDRYAADFASETLQALEWAAEQPGGRLRVD